MNIYKDESSKGINLREDHPLKKFFSISSDDFGPMPKSRFKILSCAKNLESITLVSESELDDGILKEIFQTNSFHYLKKLSIANCDNITMKTLEGGILMNENVPLQKVILSNCQNITKSDTQRYEKYLKTKNYYVEVEWN